MKNLPAPTADAPAEGVIVPEGSSRYDFRLARTRIPPRYYHAAVEDLASTGGKRPAIAAAERLLDAGPGERGLLLTGPVGVGKTHLACAIGLRWAAQSRSVLFYAMSDWLREVKETFDSRHPAGKTEGEVLRTCARADLFLLDDFGSERGTEWARMAVVTLVERLYNERTTVIMTTNLTVQDVERLYDPRLVSRIMHMLQPVQILGEDWRARRT